MDVLVVGAGIAGLSAAQDLIVAGHRAIVAESGPVVGGRLATRQMGDALLDHGAQFFTVRSDEFKDQVGGWLADGTAFEWCRGFGACPDGHPRYAGRTGMASVGQALARGLDVRTGVTITGIRAAHHGRWAVSSTVWVPAAPALTNNPVPTEPDPVEPVLTEPIGTSRSGPSNPVHSDRALVDGAALDGARFDAIVLAVPSRQALALLEAGDTATRHAPIMAVRSVAWSPTLALLVTLDGTSSVPEPGGVQLTDGLWSFVADNQRKGISAVPALTLHATPDVSATRWAEADEALRHDLLGAARPWLGDAGIVATEIVRWRYAQPTAVRPERCVVVAGTPGGHPGPIVIAGDAFGGPRVEGAFLSGKAAAARLDNAESLLGNGA